MSSNTPPPAGLTPQEIGAELHSLRNEVEGMAQHVNGWRRDLRLRQVEALGHAIEHYLRALPAAPRPAAQPELPPRAQVDLLYEYVADHAADHEDDCPGDDTCDCAYRARNDAVGACCRYLRETPRPAAPRPDAGEAPATMALCRDFEGSLFNLFTLHGPSDGMLFSARQRVVRAMLDAMTAALTPSAPAAPGTPPDWQETP